MDLREYTRDPKRVAGTLKRIGSKTITTTGCKLYVPARYRDKNLAQIGHEIYVLGIFMLAIEDKYYAVNSVTAMVRTEPSSINTVVMEGKEYLELVYEAGDSVVANNELVHNGKLLYYIFDEVPAKGNIPAFLNYEDMINLFDSAEKFAGVRLVSTPTIMHMLLSKVGRNPNNLNQYFRQITNGKDLETVRFIPLRSNTHGATNTTARLMGSYFNDNVTGALVNQVDDLENVERILRD